MHAHCSTTYCGNPVAKSMTLHLWSGKAWWVIMPLHESHFMKNFQNSVQVIPVAESRQVSNCKVLLSPTSIARCLRGSCGWTSSAMTSGIYMLNAQSECFNFKVFTHHCESSLKWSAPSRGCYCFRDMNFRNMGHWGGNLFAQYWT